MKYRSEIDGLRALAVVPVIFFHAGYSVFSGGFVGVDIFFVISGYLITTIILTELTEGRFSIIRFYERRALRILPALFVVVLSCLPFAWVLLYPDDIRNFSDSLKSVSTFLSNFYFWRNSLYFDTSSELKPLLHTWSLAVEEQFYIIFPIMLIGILKYRRQWLVPILMVIATASLFLSHWAAYNTPTLNFYLLPTRLWELLMGGFVAMYLLGRPDHSHSHSIKQWASATGILLIVYSILIFNKSTPFPSLYTVVPVLGTALVIVFGDGSTVVGKLLSFRALVGVGLISYSAYLWHQPVFSFSRHQSIEEPSKLVFVLLSLLSLFLAYLSWRFVEKPFRTRKYGRTFVFSFALCGLVGMAVIGQILPSLKGNFPLTEKEQIIHSFLTYDFKSKVRHNKCFLNSSVQSPAEFSSECTDIDTTQSSLLIWGDSHAAAASMGLRKLHGNVIQYNASRCPPLIGQKFLTAKYCSDTNDFVVKEISRIRPDIIVIDAYWYSYGNRISQLDDTLTAVQIASPESKVYLLGNVPLWPERLPLILLKHKVELINNMYLQLPLYSSLEGLDDRLRKVALRSNVSFVSALDAFCIKDKCKVSATVNDSVSVTAYDYGHLTEAGSLILANHLLSVVEDE